MKNLNSDFSKKTERMKRFVSIFIGGTLILLICVLVGFGVLAYKAVAVASEQDLTGGVKPIIEKIWCGKPGCLSQSTE